MCLEDSGKDKVMVYVEISRYSDNTGFYKVTIQGEDYYAPAELIAQAFGGTASREYSV